VPPAGLLGAINQETLKNAAISDVYPTDGDLTRHIFIHDEQPPSEIP
jgi:hypothetical protein